MAGTLVSYTLRLEDDFHRELKIALIERRIPSLKVLITDLLLAWMKDPDFERQAINTLPSPRKGSPSEFLEAEALEMLNGRFHEQLDTILNSGHSGVIRAITSDLTVFAQLLDLIEAPVSPEESGTKISTDSDAP